VAQPHTVVAQGVEAAVLQRMQVASSIDASGSPAKRARRLAEGVHVGIAIAVAVAGHQRRRGDQAQVRLQRRVDRMRGDMVGDRVGAPVKPRRCRKRDMRGPSLTG
jgi:hypothetical protein